MREDREIYKKVLTLSIPMIIQGGITNAVGLVDNLMVGSLGTESITAVSISVQLIFVFNLAIFGGLSGPGIFGAQYYGSGDTEGVRNIFRLKIWISLLCCIAGTIIFLLFGNDLVRLYLRGSENGIDADMTKRLALTYLTTMLIGFLPYGISQVYSGSLRETSHSTLPMIAGIVSVVTDIVFNYLLIYGKFGFPRHGVKGAAEATVISRIVELLVVSVFAHLKTDKYEFIKGIYKTVFFSLKKMGTVIKKGFPIFFNEFLWAGGVAALTQCYSVRGLSVVAGINISNNICNLLNVVFLNMGVAAGILCGQYLGASQFKKAKRYAVKLTAFSAYVCIGLGLILLAISGAFPKLYETTEEVRYYAKYFIIVSAIFLPAQGITNALYFIIRSGGKTFVTFLFDSVFMWLVCVPVAKILCNYTKIGIISVYAVVMAMEIIKVVIGAILLLKGLWINNLVSMKKA